MASRNSPVASDKQHQSSARPLPIPRGRDRQPAGSDESAPDMTQGSADSSRTTSSSLSSYPTARAAMASRIASGTGRNTSIDSVMSSASAASGAPSSLSNVSHSHTSSTDTTVAPAVDAPAFIDANGGPILAVERLLKERQQHAARSEQLWRLLEKQRQMVHGMHSDLEKALKEKERYRRRAKEVEEALARAENTLPRPSAAALRSSPPSSAANSGVNGVRTSHGKAGSLDFVSSTTTTTTTSSQTTAVPPSPSSNFPKPTRAATDSVVTHATHPHSARLPPSAPSDPLVNAPRSAPLQVEPHPSTPLTATNPHAKIVTPSSAEKSRKAAPAPLNLVRPESNQQAVKGDSDTQDDTSDTDVETRDFTRGRKRTRAEDDRHREELARAEEMRSLSNLLRSKKSKKSLAAAAAEAAANAAEQDASQVALPMSPPLPRQVRGSNPMGFDEPVLGSAELPAGMIAGIGLPSSPRAALDGDVQLPIQSNTSPSIASVMGSTGATLESTVTLPPKSPGLPMSPRPSDRPSNAALPRAMSSSMAASGPLSPTGLPLSPRAPKYAVPVPESDHSITAALASPQRAVPVPSTTDMMSMAERLQQSRPGTSATGSASQQNSTGDNRTSKETARGQATAREQDLLLVPNTLSSVEFKVHSSRLQAPRNGAFLYTKPDDESVFTLGVHSRSDSRQLWRVEKAPSTLPMLDAALRKEVRLVAPLPEKGLFSGHSPAKIDQRRAAIDAYFDGVLSSRLNERAADLICRFFSSDVVGAADEAQVEASIADGVPNSPRPSLYKSGWLAKKGKQFGGWKSRWFVLDKDHLRHYATPGGEHLGNIRLANAQIVMRSKDGEIDDEFRHFLIILEPKRRDSSSTLRHVLCAESDEERDQWVNAILTNIANAKNTVASPPTSPSSAQMRSQSFTSGPPPTFGPRRQRTQDSVESNGPSALRSVGYEDTVAADPPVMGTPMMGTPSIISTVPSPMPMEHGMPTSNSNISGPQDAHPIPSSELSIWNKKSSSPSRVREKETKKRSVFASFIRSSDEPGSSTHRLTRGISPRPQAATERSSTSKPIFGMPLAEAAELASPVNSNVYLPSPVYRCIQFLEVKQAYMDEGIFRLSGSNTEIDSMKAKFDSDGDLDILRSNVLDANAVASLLKRYLRELPEPILTRELHPKFVQLSDIEDQQKRLLALNWLVHKLPEANREVLVALFGFLIKVVNHSDRNKMNVKNVGIVFSPTLHIPTPLVAAFIMDHEHCFTPSPLDPRSAQQTVDSLKNVAAPAIIDELSAPRQQILSTMNASAPNSAGVGGSMNSPDPRSRVPASFGEAGTPRSLSETRSELRRANGSSDLKDMISRPIPGTTSSSAIKQSRSRSRGSPSPGSKHFISPPLSVKATPSQRDDSSAGGGLGYNPMAQSSAASSPGFYSTAALAHDGSSAENISSATRKSKRESTIQSLPSFTKPSAAFDSPSNEARKKSSYTRLRENVSNMGSLRET